MAELKTKPGDENVESFLNRVTDDQKRQDCFVLLELMQKITKTKPSMWSGGIIGKGNYRYKNDSGREGDWFLTGFSPRKQNLTIHIIAGFEPFEELLKSLGKYKIGKSCLYIQRLEDVHLPTLRKLIKESVKLVIKNNP